MCLWCKSISRKRHVAKVLLETLAPKARSIRHAIPDLAQSTIYSTVSNDVFHRLLGPNNPNFVCSEYFPGAGVGEQRGGVPHQNLEGLTFENQAFDVVVSEDVFEHVRHPDRAFREVWRVLKPGGSHIFTIPFSFDRRTVLRVDTATDKDVHLLPAQFHGDSLRDGVLVYTDFGYDMFDHWSALGFSTAVSFWTQWDLRNYGIADSCVFVGRRS